VARNAEQAAGLARALRELRLSTWPDRVPTQAELARALSSEGHVAAQTLSSWESLTNPKMPSEQRILSAYARFFCTRRSLEGEPHLITEDQLTPDERELFKELESQLLRQLHSEARNVPRIFEFDAGQVMIICTEAPANLQGQLADERDPNFTRMRKYGDLDALVELYAHLRAVNPTLYVFHRLSSEVVNDDLVRHVILVGGIAWNPFTLRFQSASQVPITQTKVPDLETGEIFEVRTGGVTRSFYPKFNDLGEGEELIEDVAYIARLRHPFRVDLTLTICNGIHSRGVYGAVRALTDDTVEEANEKYIRERFPEGEFAMLLRVPVMKTETVSPDFRDPEVRLYEWAPNRDPRR
jgi:hypothetical protein